MTAVRNAAAIGGVGMGVVALAFGLFADPETVSPALLDGMLPTPVVAQAPAGPTPQQIAAGNSLPEGAIVDREISFARTITVPPPDPRPSELRARAADQAAFAAAAAATAGGTSTMPATTAPSPGTASPPRVIDWSNAPKPGEPMLDPTPRN